MEDLKLRALDLISMFHWHLDYVEQLCSQTPARYAVVSESVQVPGNHWIDGFVEDLNQAADLWAGLDEEWTLVGVFDLAGEPGSPLERVPARIRYVLGGLDDDEASTVVGIGAHESSLNEVGFYDSRWARMPLEIED